jgi:hypothetical protein
MQEEHYLDNVARHELAARLERRQRAHKDWDADIVYAVFHAVRQASGGDITARHVAMVHPDVLQQATAEQRRLGDLLHSSRMVVFLVPRPDSTLLVMAYVREWKHWFVYGRAENETRTCAARILAQLAGLGIVSEYNHTVQFFPVDWCFPGSSSSYNNIFASFCAYVLMKNIGHFAYRDEFSACLRNELAVLSERNRADYVALLIGLLQAV